jgi:hypothetical protein
MIFQILLRQNGFEFFFLVAVRRVILAIFISTSMSSTMVIHTLDKVVRFLFPGILVLVLLPMLYHYFNGCTRAHILSIAAQI